MENIRITSGNLRGRTIKSPNSKLTHPMGSREKLAIFNMISVYLPGAKVLDAFAGSGALGIEAISRGASSVIFVEKSAQVARIIKENLTSLRIAEQGEVICGDAAKINLEEKFQVILIDPPYDKFDTFNLDSLAELLDDKGILVLSHPNKAPQLTGLNLIKTSSYARANISLYQH